MERIKVEAYDTPLGGGASTHFAINKNVFKQKFTEQHRTEIFYFQVRSKLAYTQ